MENTNYKYTFLKQNYDNSWQDYKECRTTNVLPKWDRVYITAADETQAASFRFQLQRREKFLPEGVEFIVISDRDGQRIGSGGATFGILRDVLQKRGAAGLSERILVINSGGDSKRLPQYSAVGKLFLSLPRKLEDGRVSSIFDEILVMMNSLASRMTCGMLIVTSDVLVIFNSLQVDLMRNGAVGLSVKSSAEQGTHHGVYKSKDGRVSGFLHKQSVEKLCKQGAVNERGMVNIDTGIVYLSTNVLQSLAGLIMTNGIVDNIKFDKYVNQKVALNFYSDFLYPMSEEATLDLYLEAEPEKEFNDQLMQCRKDIFAVLNGHKFYIEQTSPAKFIHFGTTEELLKLFNQGIDELSFLNWKRSINSDIKTDRYTVVNSIISPGAKIGNGCYIEHSVIGHDANIGDNCIISNSNFNGVIGDDTVVHTLLLSENQKVQRIYGINENTKSPDLWESKRYNVLDSTGAVCARAGLCDFKKADMYTILERQDSIDDRVKLTRFIDALEAKEPLAASIEILKSDKRLDVRLKELLEYAKNATFEMKSRIYLSIALMLKQENLMFEGKSWNYYENMSYESINTTVYNATLNAYSRNKQFSFACNEETIHLPVRLNFLGGWSDTPPYCMENGGTVLNAAISLNGKLPIMVKAERIDQLKIIFQTMDNDSYAEIDDISTLQVGANPSEIFNLHRACMIAIGLIPQKGGSLHNVLADLGGGIKLTTSSKLPKGSGLGGSSIIAGGCILALSKLLNLSTEQDKVFAQVTCAEQLMGTGGGWQDQVGGIMPGIKLIRTEKGIIQRMDVRVLDLNEKVKKELQERFVLVYTGQKRLALNVLRNVVENYLMYRPEIVRVLYEIQRQAAIGVFELEKGNIDGFAELMNDHWRLSKILDPGITNPSIEQIIACIKDMTSGVLITGAGGGGFLQFVLKSGVSKKDVVKRFDEIFEDSGPSVWDSEFIW